MADEDKSKQEDRDQHSETVQPVEATGAGGAGVASGGHNGGEATPSAVLSLAVLASPASSVTFSNIPGDYETLELHWLARTTTPYGPVRAVFNDDTGGNYEYRVKPYYEHPSQYQSTSASFMYIGMLSDTNALPAIYASGGVMRIPGYAGANFYKAVHSHHQVYESTASPARRGGQTGRWKSTSAITKITLDGYGYAFQIGSRFLLIGTG